jgi:hypothetical protein
VTVGQNLLSTAGEERVDARVRPMTWSRLMALQRLQDTDLLYDVLERQQKMADQRFGSGDSTIADSAQSSTSLTNEAAADTTTVTTVSSPAAGR